MAITVSVPTIWSTRIKQYLDKSMVYAAALTNTNYKGEIKDAGDTVKILNVGPVAISDYAGILAAPANLTDEATTLTISQKKSFNFKVDDVDDQFSVIKLVDEGSQRAAYGLRDVLDQYIASFYSEVAAGNGYGTDLAPIVVGFAAGETSPYDAHLILAELLNDANVPFENRRAVYPFWFARALKRQLGIERDSNLGDRVVTSGEVMTVDGVRIFQSPQVPNTAGAQYKALMGQPFITFAQAILKTETYRVESAFATGVKGLSVYGGKLTHPTGLSLGTFNKGQLTRQP